ncbi:MAG: hypothetical protein GWO15_07590 [Nitrosopumilaceae archaeon]|nr:hypothetical protein [Nitrosopumilaceae archaeon]
MVKNLIDYLTSKNLQITRAKYKGYKEPEEITEFVPDIVGFNKKSQLFHIGKVVNCDEMEDQEVISQLQYFSNMEMEDGTSKGKLIEFYIGVPKSCLSEMEKHLNSYSINTENVHIIPIDV